MMVPGDGKEDHRISLIPASEGGARCAAAGKDLDNEHAAAEHGHGGR